MTQGAQDGLNTFINENISPSLRRTVLREIFDQSIRKNEIIKLLRVIEPVD